MFMTFIPGKHLSIYTIPIMFFTIISEIIIYHFSCPHELVYAFINLFTQLINIYKAIGQMHIQLLSYKLFNNN